MEDKPLHYIPEADYAKAIGQLRLQMNGVFRGEFRMYGVDKLLPGTIETIVRL